MSSHYEELKSILKNHMEDNFDPLYESLKARVEITEEKLFPEELLLKLSSSIDERYSTTQVAKWLKVNDSTLRNYINGLKEYIQTYEVKRFIKLDLFGVYRLHMIFIFVQDYGEKLQHLLVRVGLEAELSSGNTVRLNNTGKDYTEHTDKKIKEVLEFQQFLLLKTEYENNLKEINEYKKANKQLQREIEHLDLLKGLHSSKEVEKEKVKRLSEVVAEKVTVISRMEKEQHKKQGFFERLFGKKENVPVEQDNESKDELLSTLIHEEDDENRDLVQSIDEKIERLLEEQQTNNQALEQLKIAAQKKEEQINDQFPDRKIYLENKNPV
ncbi:hypothetical protein [Bacillus sp. FJAT-44742]|uniref:hypothetical protein n=1 Tax=Bacillus sp. FJAT-44742 TaxID=2014005 RepID=UPI000C238DB4|nr:hypothetical protein [Bacillus sp. FJAT-44742]